MLVVFENSSILAIAIVVDEALFWVLLFGGLVARYLLRRRRLSTVLLAGAPVVDLVLVALTLTDVARGSEPSGVHALAAVYLGVSLAFGPHIVRWADGWFTCRYAGGPRPQKVPPTGPVRLRHEWQDFLRALLAWVIAVPFLLVMQLVSGWRVPQTVEDLADGGVLWAATGLLSIVVVLWFVTGPVYAAIFLRRAPRSSGAGSQA